MPNTLFDHEKLDVYKLELEFISWLKDLFEDLRERKAMLHRIVSMLTKWVDRFDDAPGMARAQEPRMRTSTTGGPYNHA